ncbi:Dabb family protein [Homoserinimonas sp. A447]
MIRHTVAFSLHHENGSAAESDFLDSALVLASIPGVDRFEQLRQVSPKSDFQFSFSMQFADAAAYEAYNAHPLHRSFVSNRWEKEVADFQELDYVPLNDGRSETMVE